MARGKSHMPQHRQGEAIHHVENRSGTPSKHVSPLGGVSNAPVAPGQGMPTGPGPGASAPDASTALPPGVPPVPVGS